MEFTAVSGHPFEVMEEDRKFTGTLRQQANNRKRRVKPYDQSESPSPSRVNISKKSYNAVKKKDFPPVSYEELGIIPVKDFDYSNYTKVISIPDLFRIGVDTVELDLRVTLLRVLGDLERCAPSIT